MPTRPVNMRRSGVEMPCLPTTPPPHSRFFSAGWDRTGRIRELSRTSPFANFDTKSFVRSTNLTDPFLEASFFSQDDYENDDEEDDIFSMSPLYSVFQAQQSTHGLQSANIAFASSPVLPQPPRLLHSPFGRDSLPCEEDVHTAIALLQLHQDSQAIFASGAPDEQHHQYNKTAAFGPAQCAARITSETTQAMLSLHNVSDSVLLDKRPSPTTLLLPYHQEHHKPSWSREFVHGSSGAVGKGSNTPPSSVFDSLHEPTPCCSLTSSIASQPATTTPDSNSSKPWFQGEPNESIADMLLGLRDHVDRIIVAIQASNAESLRCV